MPFKKGQSGNPKGAEPGSRAPSNKTIKNAIKKCSVEAIENLSKYMKDCSDYIDDRWEKFHALSAQIDVAPEGEKEKLIEKQDEIRKNIFTYYVKLADVSQCFLDYAHKHIVNDERVNRSTKTVDEEDTKDPPAKVSLKAVES